MTQVDIRDDRHADFGTGGTSDMTLAQRITHRLTVNFAPLQYKLDDESALHAGHAGAASGGRHYRLLMVSDRFEGSPRIARHRLVYDCLADLMRSDIHALAIVALAPSETAITESRPG